MRLIFVILIFFTGTVLSKYYEKTRFDRSIHDNLESSAVNEDAEKKQWIFTDHETHFRAYRDRHENNCYLEKLENDIDAKEYLNTKFQPRNQISKTYYVLDDALTKLEAWRLAGGRIVDYCKGRNIILLQNTVPIPEQTIDPFFNILPYDENDIAARRVADVLLTPLINRAKRQIEFEKRQQLNKNFNQRRSRRQTQQPQGKFRGQTQSQYLNIGNDDQKEGRAEAEATQQSSHSIVSGSRGMGQAQSMSFGSIGCEDCSKYTSETAPDRYTQFPSTSDSGRGPLLKPEGITYPRDRTPGTLIKDGRPYAGGVTYPGSAPSTTTGGGAVYPGSAPGTTTGGGTVYPGSAPGTTIGSGVIYPVHIPDTQIITGAKVPYPPGPGSGPTYSDYVPDSRTPTTGGTVTYTGGGPATTATGSGTTYPGTIPSTKVGGGMIYPGGMPGTTTGGGVVYPGSVPGTTTGGGVSYPGGVPGTTPGGGVVYPGGVPGTTTGGGVAYPGGAPGTTTGGGVVYPGGVPGTTTGGGVVYPGGVPGTTTGGGVAYPGGAPGTTSGGGVVYPGGVPGSTTGGGVAYPGGAPGTTSGGGVVYPGGVPGSTTGGGVAYPGGAPGTTTGGGAAYPGRAPGTTTGGGVAYPGGVPGTTTGGGVVYPGGVPGTTTGGGVPYPGGVPGTTTGGGVVYPGGVPGTTTGGGVPYPGGVPGSTTGGGVAYPRGVPGSTTGGGVAYPGGVPGSTTGGGVVYPGGVPGSTTGGGIAYPGGVPGTATGGGVAYPGGVPGTTTGGTIAYPGGSPDTTTIGGGVVYPGRIPGSISGTTTAGSGVSYPGITSTGSVVYPGGSGAVPDSKGTIRGPISQIESKAVADATVYQNGQMFEVNPPGERTYPTVGDGIRYPGGPTVTGYPGSVSLPPGQLKETVRYPDKKGDGTYTGGTVPTNMGTTNLYPGTSPGVIIPSSGYPQQEQYPGYPQQGQYPGYPQQGQYPGYPQQGQYPGTVTWQNGAKSTIQQYPSEGQNVRHQYPMNAGEVSQYYQQPSGVPSTEEDNSNSQASSNIKQTDGGTQASASAQGQFGQGTAQSQVTGTYSGSGSFSAQAGSSDVNKSAQTEVNGGKEGATSNAQGTGGHGKSQAQVQLDSESGATSTGAQSSGWNHGTNSQVQASSKGGMADAQANGEGSTSSQAQIGFQPYLQTDEKVERHSIPFRGGGTASAQSGTHRGQSQSQLEGSFQYGITYTGAAQAGSGSGAAASRKPFSFNLTDTELFKPFKPSYVPQIVKNDNSKTTNASSDIDYEYKGDKIQQGLQTSSSSQKAVVMKPTNENSKNDKQTQPVEKSQIDDTTYDYEEEYDAEEDDGEERNYQSQTVHLATGNQYDIHVKQDSNTAQVGDMLQPGQSLSGYTIPPGFRGKVTSVAGSETIAHGDGKSQSQSVSLVPVEPNIAHGNKSPVSETRSLKTNSERLVNNHLLSHERQQHNHLQIQNRQPTGENSKSTTNIPMKPSYYTVTNSVAGKMDDSNNSARKYEHRYYTKSSTCGYFTFSCNIVYGSNGRTKICKPKMPTYPDGTPMKC